MFEIYRNKKDLPYNINAKANKLYYAERAGDNQSLQLEALTCPFSSISPSVLKNNVESYGGRSILELNTQESKLTREGFILKREVLHPEKTFISQITQFSESSFDVVRLVLFVDRFRLNYFQYHFPNVRASENKLVLGKYKRMEKPSQEDLELWNDVINNVIMNKISRD